MISDSHDDEDVKDSDSDDDEDDYDDTSSYDLEDDEDEKLDEACLDLLERIIGTNILMTRQEAIVEVENRFDAALKDDATAAEIKVIRKLCYELNLASDEDFTKLKNAIFDT